MRASSHHAETRRAAPETAARWGGGGIVEISRHRIEKEEYWKIADDEQQIYPEYIVQMQLEIRKEAGKVLGYINILGYALAFLLRIKQLFQLVMVF